MKKIQYVLALSSILGSVWSVSASAFAPTIFYGAAFFTANQACPDLKITLGESLVLDADYTHFQVSEDSSSGFKPLLKFSVPTDGAYYFRGSIGQQSANELMTNAFDGSGVPGAGTCLLTAVSGG